MRVYQARDCRAFRLWSVRGSSLRVFGRGRHCDAPKILSPRMLAAHVLASRSLHSTNSRACAGAFATRAPEISFVRANACRLPLMCPRSSTNIRVLQRKLQRPYSWPYARTTVANQLVPPLAHLAHIPPSCPPCLLRFFF